MSRTLFRRFVSLISLALLLGIVTEMTGCAAPPPPPPARVEVRTTKPHPKAVWVSGHWQWKGKKKGYVWVPGHWKK